MEVKLFYLMLHSESDCIFICTDEELDQNLNLQCDILSQGYALTSLISQGLAEAKKHNCTFAGYKEPYENKRKEHSVKAGTVNPVKLKNHK